MTCSNPREHNLNNLAAYRVRQTIANSLVQTPGLLVQEHAGAGSYLDAIAHSRRLRHISEDPYAERHIISWAVVTPVYGDGCEGQPF